MKGEIYMYTNFKPTVSLEEEDRRLLIDLGNFADTFREEFCSKMYCENCPYQDNCNEILGQSGPSETIDKIIDFFNTLKEEG